MDELKAILADETKFNELAHVGFTKTDTDKSGLIDAAELEAAMKEISTELGIPAPSKEDVSNVMTALDTDKSGKIDFNEFKVFVRKVFEAFISVAENGGA
jgi:Ca2+-binding EF-hand superfamily protein